ncbi:hypothetical protein JD79_02848 [Geodermatophilus normandii]|uniref:Uncharacterized protein n=1 Tax=Geodermatophilus normandii TaxID=1137989 RepID=A0A317QL20_9ACTN|nr:hypothetical protein JD79_02848 [Geodermatophilus normandii]
MRNAPPARSVALTLGLLVLAACGMDASDRSGGAAVVGVVDAGMVDTGMVDAGMVDAAGDTGGPPDVPPPVLPPAAVGAAPPVPDPASVAGLVLSREDTRTPEDERRLTTAPVPGLVALDGVLRGMVDAEVRRYEAGLAPGQWHQLTVGSTPVLAAGDVLGIRVATSVRTGGLPAATTARTVYADVATGETWTSTDLVADPAALFGWFTGAVERAGLGHALLGRSAVLADLRFARDGALSLVVGGGDGRAEPFGDVAVRVDPLAADGVLSDAGRRVRAAATAAAPFRGVPRHPPHRPSPAAAGAPSPPEPRRRPSLRRRRSRPLRPARSTAPCCGASRSRSTTAPAPTPRSSSTTCAPRTSAPRSSSSGGTRPHTRTWSVGWSPTATPSATTPGAIPACPTSARPPWAPSSTGPPRSWPAWG